MSGHGGARPGAGAPRGGISETRRRLVNAIEQGLELAGRSKGMEGTREQVAEQAAAAIVSDMILAGQGDDVLKIWATVAPKNDDGEGGKGKQSTLAASLAAVGKRLGASGAPHAPADDTEAPADSTTYEHGAPDTASDGRANPGLEYTFLPQHALPLELPARGNHGEGEGALGQGGHPPGATPTPTTALEAENFENFSGDGK